MVNNESNRWAPILQRWEVLDELLGANCWIVRDDLLPFPLAGNKVRKIDAEIESAPENIDVLITNGGIDSNHCRTVAMIAAQRGITSHLVLHGEDFNSEQSSPRMLRALGATFDIGPASTISERIKHASEQWAMVGKKVHVISGGGHTRAGAQAFRDAGLSIFRKNRYDQVFVASGTGATQGGLVAAAELSDSNPEIIGVSVARESSRGVQPVREASKWAGARNPAVTFLDDYRAGGYGKNDERVEEAVQLGWSIGLPLDGTYTGKAFAGMLDWSRRGLLGQTILFWHTGGLFNWLSSTNG